MYQFWQKISRCYWRNPAGIFILDIYISYVCKSLANRSYAIMNLNRNAFPCAYPMAVYVPECLRSALTTTGTYLPAGVIVFQHCRRKRSSRAA
jgi:hypothetical protein